MKNILKLSKFQLRNKRNTIIGWSVGTFAMMFLYMILFDSMKELGQAKLEAMPKEMMQFMGVESLDIMLNWIAYFGMIFGIFVMVVSIFAATFSGSIFFNEEKSKSIEFLDALPVSRSEVYYSKVLTSFVGVLFVVISTVIAAALCGVINGGDTFVVMDFLTIVKVSSFTIFFFMAVACFFGGVTGKVSAGMAGATITVAIYMLGYLSRLLEDKGDILSYFSPFVLFDATSALALSTQTIGFLIGYIVLFVLLIVGGSFFYNRRDFHI